VALEEFGEIYRHYMESTPAWFSKFNVNKTIST
jgi:protein-S-isoprenylcysteine O-methyltransferase Ste14